jgi:hypothetical protein
MKSNFDYIYFFFFLLRSDDMTETIHRDLCDEMVLLCLKKLEQLII